MQIKDIPEGMRLKQAAGWNQLEQDWILFLVAGQDSCFVAEADGQVIGTVTIINYANRFSWIGMVLVDPEIRRMGIGTALLREAIRVASGKGTVRLDATPEGKKLYDTLGFIDEYHLSRYQLAKCNRDDLPLPALSCLKMSPDDLVRIIPYDENIFGAPRPVILQSLLDMGPDYAWVSMLDDQIQGYCLGRSGSHFEQVGPVIADRDEVASALLLHALRQCHGQSAVVDVLDDQLAFRTLIERIGFIIQRPFIRMFLERHDYPGKPEYQYAIAGPEIG